LPISRFNPALVEASPVFVAPGAFQVLPGLGTAMSKPISGGLLLGVAPFGPFPRDSKVDDGCHAEISEDSGRTAVPG
jgi:hypothetical protein